MSLLAMVFIFFSCTDLQIVDNDIVPESLSKNGVSAGINLIDSNLLPEPDVNAITKVTNNSKYKAYGGASRLYKLVLVHPKGEAAGSNGAPVVSNFADAITRVESGGVIKVFPGEYILDELVIIDRAVKIEPMGGTSPVIRNTGAHAFLVTGDHEGLVTFKDLNFENAGGHSSVAAKGAEVLVTGSDFDVTNGLSGAFAWEDATLNIKDSNFANGVAAAFARGDNTNLNIYTSSFNNHSHVTLQYQWGSDGTVEENTMTDCGIHGCSQAFLGSEVDILNNYFSDDVTDAEVNGFFHHIVLYIGANGRVNGNLFDGCGHGQCIAGINRAVLEISENEFRIYEEHKTRFVIVGSDGTGGNDPQGREVDITVADNLITGIGGNYKNDPGNPDAYAIKLGGLLIENLGRMEAYRNTIVNANMGISVLSGGVLSVGQDNIIQDVLTAVASYDLSGLGQSFAKLQSNDFTGYITSILNDTFDSGSNLTCNWWGTTAGPQSMAGALSSVSISTPWATEPVASSSVTSCSGGSTGMPVAGLIAYWPADGTAEDMASGHDGTLVDDATYASGKINQAFHIPNEEKSSENNYTGSDWIEVPDHEAWDFSSGEFTIGTWVNFTSVFSSGDNQQPIIGHTEGPGELNKWIFWLSDGAITFHINTPNEQGLTTVWYPLNPDADIWYHLVITHQDDTWQLYVDGVLVYEEENTTQIPDANFQLTLGKAEEHWLEGLLDEVVIYNRALNSSEVTGLFLNGIN